MIVHRKTLLALAVVALAFIPVRTCAARGATQDHKSREKPSPVKLYGQIDELSYLCSSAGLSLSGNGPPYKVAKVSLGSAAAYSGVRDGDKVTHLVSDDDSITVTIERGGKTYQAVIATDVKGVRSQFEQRKVPWALETAAFDKKIEKIGKCKIVVVLDSTKSMADAHAGCPGDLSKWDWCRQQLDSLYFATARVLDGGFDLVSFANGGYQEWKGVTIFDLKQFYDRTKPFGDRKDLAKPLEQVLHDTIRSDNDKPCIIMVLTDGVQNAGTPLEQVLIDASKQVKKPSMVSVLFLPIGESLFADQLFDDLDENLVAKGAKYKIATYKPFSDFRNKGLLWELLQTVHQVSEQNNSASSM